MAESGASESFGSILENWSNIANLFVAFVIAGLLPVMKHFGKKYGEWKEKKEAEELEQEKEAIVDIAKQVQQPIEEKMDKIEELLTTYEAQNRKLLDHMIFIESLLQSGRVSFRGPGRPSKHFDHSTGGGDKSD